MGEGEPGDSDSPSPDELARAVLQVPVDQRVTVAGELRALRRMLRRELESIREDVTVIARRMDEVPELLEQNAQAVDRVADQLEKLRLRAAEKKA